MARGSGNRGIAEADKALTRIGPADAVAPPPPDRVDPFDLSFIRAAQTALRNAQDAYNASEVVAQLRAAEHGVQTFSAFLQHKYGLTDGDNIAEDGTIVRAPVVVAVPVETDAPGVGAIEGE